MTNFTIANPTNVLMECGFACKRAAADCNAIYVQGTECHLLKVRYDQESRKILLKCWHLIILIKKKVGCKLMDYTKNDAVTIYMKHSLSATLQLPYDHGKFFSKNVESEINNFPLSDRKFLFVDEQHIYELTTFTRVCFPIQDHPWPDLVDDVREVVRGKRNCCQSLTRFVKLAGQWPKYHNMRRERDRCCPWEMPLS